RPGAEAGRHHTPRAAGASTGRPPLVRPPRDRLSGPGHVPGHHAGGRRVAGRVGREHGSAARAHRAGRVLAGLRDVLGTGPCRGPAAAGRHHRPVRVHAHGGGVPARPRRPHRLPGGDRSRHARLRDQRGLGQAGARPHGRRRRRGHVPRVAGATHRRSGCAPDPRRLAGRGDLSHARAHLVLATVVVLWAGAFAAIKHLLEAGLSAPEIAATLYLSGGLPGLSRRDWTRVIVAGVCWVAVYHLALNEGELRTTSGTAAVIVGTAPGM